MLLSISLATKAHLYLWDEPMNYIDVISREQIEKVILDNDITLIFVEHDNYFKKKIANKNIEINSNKRYNFMNFYNNLKKIEFFRQFILIFS